MQEIVLGSCQSLDHMTYGQGDSYTGTWQPWGRWASEKNYQKEFLLYSKDNVDIQSLSLNLSD